MAGGPVVLLGQGEQYDDPDDWRELIRDRRIRRGVELAVRRDGLTFLRRPEEVPELAVVLDAVDPVGAPSQPALAVAKGAPALGGTSVPPTSSAENRAAGLATPAAVPPGAAGQPAPARALPTAAPRRKWRFGVWRWVIGLGALLLLRLCAHDGFGPFPAFGGLASSLTPGRVDAASRSAGCERLRGWIARAACGDPELQRLRPALGRAYAVRAQALRPSARPALAAAQARWQDGRSACRFEPDPAACLEDRYRARIAELRHGG